MIVAKQGLTAQELSEIRELAEVCNKFEAITMKLNMEMLETRAQDVTNDFLYYEDGKLVGYYGLYAFQSAEMAAMVHPEARRKGIFKQMQAAAVEELKKRGYTQMLLVVDSGSDSGSSVAKHLGGTYTFSEYRMELGTPNIGPKRYEELELRRATVEDAEFIAGCVTDAFGYPSKPKGAEHFAQPNLRVYILVRSGEPVGVINASVDGKTGSIYGFSVLKAEQGKGYGRQALSETVQELLAAGYEHVDLEVACENKRALGLYQSVGFEESGGIDYYELPLT